MTGIKPSHLSHLNFTGTCCLFITLRVVGPSARVGSSIAGVWTFKALPIWGPDSQGNFDSTCVMSVKQHFNGAIQEEDLLEWWAALHNNYPKPFSVRCCRKKSGSSMPMHQTLTTTYIFSCSLPGKLSLLRLTESLLRASEQLTVS